MRLARRPHLYSADGAERDARIIDPARVAPPCGARWLRSIAFAWALAWDTSGSIRASDWLPYRGSRSARARRGAPRRRRVPACAGCHSSPRGCLIGFASGRRSPRPGLPCRRSRVTRPARAVLRDRAPDAARHAPLRGRPPRGDGRRRDRPDDSLLWTAVWLREGGDPDVLYSAGRLDFPVTYWNGQAAMALARILAGDRARGRRELHPALRALALGGATAMLCSLVGHAEQGWRRRAGRVRDRRLRRLARAPAAARSLRDRVRARRRSPPTR